MTRDLPDLVYTFKSISDDGSQSIYFQQQVLLTASQSLSFYSGIEQFDRLCTDSCKSFWMLGYPAGSKLRELNPTYCEGRWCSLCKARITLKHS
ncbi:MAG: hypothetical protein KME16_21160 [Scytolyngbya sp. HA4215-MV1]|nr:hypothetical protein [Scytolyngbya sp. HA4215-MV1]